MAVWDPWLPFCCPPLAPAATTVHSGCMPPPPSTTYQRLRQYIAERMRMSPIDQPLMRLELLGH